MKQNRPWVRAGEPATAANRSDDDSTMHDAISASVNHEVRAARVGEALEMSMLSLSLSHTEREREKQRVD